MSDFIESKSPKAKGKRITTLDVASITDITPEPEIVEEEVEGDEGDETEKETPTEIVDVPLEISAPMPESSKPVDEQLSLF